MTSEATDRGGGPTVRQGPPAVVREPVNGSVVAPAPGRSRSLPVADTATGGHHREPPRPRGRLTVAQWTRLGLLALSLVVLGGVAGFAVATGTTEQYAARADLLYTVTREQPTGFLREDRNISTQLVMLQSRTVLGPVAEEWGMSVEDLEAVTTASVVEESEIITVQLIDPDPRQAQAVLASVIARYLEVSPNDDRAELRTYLDTELAGVLARIEQIPVGAADRAAQLAPLVDREQWLRTRLDELTFTDIAGPEADVLVQPYVEADPISPRPALTTAAGTSAGLVVALLAVAILARRTTRPT